MNTDVLSPTGLPGVDGADLRTLSLVPSWTPPPAASRCDRMTELLVATGRGDRGAFARLYRMAAPRLLGQSMRIVRDRAAAEDVLQDAFVTIWQRAGTFDPDRSAASTWMTTIVRNRSLDRLRARGRHAPCGENCTAGESIESAPDPAPGPEAAHALAQETGRVERVLGALPGHQRQVLALAYWHGFSHAEIARRLDLPLGTVKSWIRRALAALATTVAH